MRSDMIKVGVDKAPARGLLYATGQVKSAKDMQKPFIAICNSYIDIVPGHVHLRELADVAKEAIREMGGIPFEFNTIGVDDGIAMGHIGMRYSLPSREIIADAAETVINAHWFDGVFYIPNCDKITPGMILASLRTNVPAVFCSGGPMKGGVDMTGHQATLSSLFEAVGTYQAGDMTKKELDYLEQNPDCTFSSLVDSVKASVAKTSDQNVSEFGDLSYRDYKVSEFFGLLPSKRLRSVGNEDNDSINVAVPDIPVHLAKWAAIRAQSLDSKLLEMYQKELLAQAKQEVEIMRLGRLLLNEKAANNALHAPVEAFAADCVRELSLKLAEKCGHKIPFPAKENNLLRSICLPGISAPEIDWEDICI